jgi:hypothetical protein
MAHQGLSASRVRLIVWAPEPHGQAWQCGMIRVVDGYELTPWDHARLISERVQELHDRIPAKQAQRIVQDLAVDVGDARLIAVPSPEEMGDSLVEYLKPNLLERGGLIESPMVCRAQPDATQDDWDEMTFETWLANAA